MEIDLKEQMLDLCASAGFEPTDNIENIVKAKTRAGIGLRCPCDKFNHERFCISEKCASDIIAQGHCRCNCFKKKS